jgi:hypothetical protein
MFIQVHVWLYSRSCVLQVGNCFNSYLLSIPFMLHNSFFSLVTTPFKAIYLLLSPLFVLIKGILGVVFFFARIRLCTFYSSTTFFPSCLFVFVLDDTHIIGPVSVVF